MMHSMVSMWSGARQLLRSLRESAIALVSRTLAVESIISVTHLRLAAAASGGPALSAAAAPATWIPEAKPTESVEERLVEAPPTEERPASRWRFTLRVTHERAVTLLAAALSIGGFAWYSAHGYTLTYTDAVSHMMIARRVLFSPTPGLGQLGTVWPPFNHILMLPFVWIDPLYRIGLAGALPSMVCYVIATLYLFRSAKLLFSSVAAGWVAAAIFALNPNTLYLQSTPMSELVLLGMIILGLFHLFRWVETERVMDLVICAAAFAAGTLVRYDAWALAAVELLVVASIAWRRHGVQAAEAMVWLYSMLAFAGGTAWLLYNWVLDGNPLYFLDGPYSAKYQEDVIKSQLGLPTYHNIVLSTREYLQAAADLSAWPLLALAGLGLIVALVRFRLSHRMLPVYAMWTLLAFNVLSLFLGITIMYTPQIHVYHATGYFNMRYGVMVMPEVALFAAVLASWRREWIFVGLMLAVVFSGLNPNLGLPYSLRDPLSSMQWAKNRQEGLWLKQHYHGGLILAGGAPFPAMVYSTGLPDQDFVNENTPSTFDRTVAAPQKYVTWIVMNSQTSAVYDAVQARLANRSDWRKYYVLRATINSIQFYERIGGSTVAQRVGVAGRVTSR